MLAVEKEVDLNLEKRKGVCYFTKDQRGFCMHLRENRFLLSLFIIVMISENKGIAKYIRMIVQTVLNNSNMQFAR